MSFAWVRRAVGACAAPCAHLAVDRQMSPPSHAVLFGPYGPLAPLSFGSAVGIRFAAPPS